MIKISRRLTLLFGFITLMAMAAGADQVVMQNGDVFNGKVMEMSTNTLALQNDNLGLVTLSRDKVAKITFGTIAIKVPTPVVSATNDIIVDYHPAAGTNSSSGLAAEMRGIRSQTNLIQEVEAQVLGSSASPEAVNKFNEVLDGLSTGKIDMNQLRAEAQSAADQLRSYTNELGPDASGEAAGYLSVLDGFLQETAPANVTTNSATP
jgi:threonine dehydrogenase-like Zn-dependent dehydrogenase